MIGKTISHYKIIEKLGEGGMGVVYKAEDLKLDRFVALKFLPPSFSYDEEAKQRFVHEAQSASALDHPNICTIHEISETEEEQLFIAMSYYVGETLKKKIEKGPLSIEEAIDITSQIAQGLKRANDKGIVHRDIKPANIFVANDGLVKILDFGLAKSASRNTMTQLGSTMGTVAYMSPEQTHGEEVDHRTDIWSLGVVIYEMITGQLPFKGEYEQAIIYSILNEEPVPPRGIREDIPAVIEGIITKTLGKESVERYQSIDVLLADLRTLQKDSKTVQNTPVLNETNKWTIFKFVGIVLSIIFIIVVILYFFPSRIDSIAVLPLENISGDPQYEYFADGMTDALIDALGKISALKVISRTSIMQYKGVHKSAVDIGNELDADVLVEGTVLSIGDQVRIIIQLIDTREDKNLWNGRYESELKDILKLQSNVSQKIANEIKVTITPEEKISLAQTEEVNSEAYRLYLNGRYYWNKRTPVSLYKGISYFNQAIKKDSNYALAYTGLADSYHLLSTYGLLKPKDAFTKSKRAVNKALELDGKLSDAHNSLAAINYFYAWNWKDAEKEFIKAIELNPNNYLAHRWYALFLTTRNRRSEALNELNYAIAINPFYPLGYIDLGRYYYNYREFENAIPHLLRAKELDNNNYLAPAYLGLALLQIEQFDKAIAELELAVKLSLESEPGTLAALSYAYSLSGKRDSAYKMISHIEKISSQRYVNPYYHAVINIGLEEYDTAIDWLERGVSDRSDWMLYLDLAPIFDPVRKDPRFAKLIDKIGLRE